MSPLLILGLLVVFGLLLGLVASRFGLPRVAAYVVAGMVFSPGMLGEPLGIRVGAWAEPLTTAALGVIAYLIGGSMTTTQLRRTGKTIVGSTLGESFGAALVVFTAVLVVSPEVSDFPLPMLALAFAAIGAWIAGAPSAVRRWLGFGLVPQAGVAVGLALALGHEPAFLEVSAIILNVILATTLLYELLGPFATWFALQHTGEIGVKRLDKTV